MEHKLVTIKQWDVHWHTSLTHKSEGKGRRERNQGSKEERRESMSERGGKTWQAGEIWIHMTDGRHGMNTRRGTWQQKRETRVTQRTEKQGEPNRQGNIRNWKRIINSRLLNVNYNIMKNNTKTLGQMTVPPKKNKTKTTQPGWVAGSRTEGPGPNQNSSGGQPRVRQHGSPKRSQSGGQPLHQQVWSFGVSLRSYTVI